MQTKSALIAGAGGLVGSHLLYCLLNAPEYNKITIIVRKSLGISHPKLTEAVINFNEMPKHADLFNVNDVFCCLGTTIKKAGSQDAFKKVDVDYPLSIGTQAKQYRVEKYLIVSSIGADFNSKVFYLRMKGLVEKSLTDMGLQSLFIFRPSFLAGDRKEFRFGEKMAGAIYKGVSFLMVGGLKKYKSIEALTVAKAMYKAAQMPSEGVHIYLSDEIETLAK